MKAFRITDWWTKHENAYSRKLEKLQWYSKPNRYDGSAFRLMMREDDRNDLYCFWVVLCDVASKNSVYDERGWLVRNGEALDAQWLEAMTGFAKGGFERALGFFTQPRIGWLVEDDFTPERARQLASANPLAGDANRLAASANQVASDANRLVQPDQHYIGIGTGMEREKGSRLLAQESKTQWAVLNRAIKNLAPREDELDEKERKLLGCLRLAFERLQAKQTRGDWTPLSDAENPLIPKRKSA